MITVIIPTHNRKNNVRLTLTGLKQQSLEKDLFEVVLVDDGSTDMTSDILEEFKEVFPKFKYAYIFKKDVWNASRPRNFGAKLAEKDSEAFLFVDSDVVLNPDALASYHEDLQVNPDRVVIGPYNFLPPQMVTPLDIEHNFDLFKTGQLPKMSSNGGGMGHIGNDVRKQSFEKATTPNDLFDTAFDGLACFGGNLLIPKSIFWRAGGYDENIFHGCEDGDFGLTLWELGIKFSYDSRCIGFHNWHPLSQARAEGAGGEIRKLNLKHFGTTEQDLIQYTRDFYRKQGFPDWQPPAEWLTEEGKEK